MSGYQNPFANQGLAGIPGVSQQFQQFPPPPSEFVHFQRIRLKHISTMIEQLNERADAKAVLMAEKKAIEEFLDQ